MGSIENVPGQRSGYERILDEISETGYVGTELGDWGFMPTDPVQLAAELQKRNLEMTGSWVNVYMAHDSRYAESLENCLRTARQLSKVCDEVYEIPHRTKNAGRIKSGDEMDALTRKIFNANINRICKQVKEETGVKVLFHHHIGTWIETPEEIDRLLNDTIIDICFDSGHCFFGGGNPLEMVKKYYSRVGVIHFKDCEPQVAERSRREGWDAFESLRHGIFPELGKGGINFQGITDHLKTMNYSGWIIVEQDVIPGMGDPKNSAYRNREFIRTLGL
ncbi:hypothetical protein CHS0354_035193 [Potamilus streckersoni]|uniref:Xylose isomerase-like TIM barrel domain-containing protein n=1 Tax=Potamilus streckersoni TaxID=2493646 RepID=A0AAE0VP85_9BIVA|nr:hypothetical protein CHS0354_035193 [Potamilus streckersoni]